MDFRQMPYTHPNDFNIDSVSAQVNFNSHDDRLQQGQGPAVFYDETSPVPSYPQSQISMMAPEPGMYPTMYPTMPGEMARAHVPLPVPPAGRLPYPSYPAGSLVSQPAPAPGMTPWNPHGFVGAMDGPRSARSDEMLVQEKPYRRKQKSKGCDCFITCTVLIMTLLIGGAIAAAIVLSDGA